MNWYTLTMIDDSNRGEGKLGQKIWGVMLVLKWVFIFKDFDGVWSFVRLLRVNRLTSTVNRLRRFERRTWVVIVHWVESSRGRTSPLRNNIKWALLLPRSPHSSLASGLNANSIELICRLAWDEEQSWVSQRTRIARVGKRQSWSSTKCGNHVGLIRDLLTRYVSSSLYLALSRRFLESLIDNFSFPAKNRSTNYRLFTATSYPSLLLYSFHVNLHIAYLQLRSPHLTLFHSESEHPFALFSVERRDRAGGRR